MTVGRLVELAGGFSPGNSEAAIVIVRRVAGKVTRIDGDLSTPLRAADEVKVQRK